MVWDSLFQLFTALSWVGGMPAALLLPQDSRVLPCEGVVPLCGPAHGFSRALRSSVLATFCYLCGPVLCACGREVSSYHTESKGQRPQMEKGGLLAELSPL